MSAKHLQDYVNEYAFSYNHGSDEAPMFAIGEGAGAEGEARTLRTVRTDRLNAHINPLEALRLQPTATSICIPILA